MRECHYGAKCSLLKCLGNPIMKQWYIFTCTLGSLTSKICLEARNFFCTYWKATVYVSTSELRHVVPWSNRTRPAWVLHWPRLVRVTTVQQRLHSSSYVPFEFWEYVSVKFHIGKTHLNQLGHWGRVVGFLQGGRLTGERAWVCWLRSKGNILRKGRVKDLWVFVVE